MKSLNRPKMINKEVMDKLTNLPSLNNYLSSTSDRKVNKILGKDIVEQPIILKYLEYKGMEEALKIIDKKIAKLLRLGQKGKLNNWLLADDQQFNSMTAERYIADYLEETVNKSDTFLFEDNMRTEGVDAFVAKDSKRIGVEITTLNGFLAEWMLIERLSWLLKKSDEEFLKTGNLEIYYHGRKLVQFRKSSNLIQSMQQYIRKIYSNISNIEELKALGIKLKIDTKRKSGCASWHQVDEKDPSWIKDFMDDITKGVISKIKSKEKQLSDQLENIIFVGVNHQGNINWLNPFIFRELCTNPNVKLYARQIKVIKEFFYSNLPANVLGVVFFLYSLFQEKPFYPICLVRNGKLKHDQYKELYSLLESQAENKP